MTNRAALAMFIVTLASIACDVAHDPDRVEERFLGWADRDFIAYDGGLDPQNPGCVREQGGSACSGGALVAPRVFRDACVDDTTLREFYAGEWGWFGFDDCGANACCESYSSSSVDCDDYCGPTMAGRCVADGHVEVCGDEPLARCVCEH